MSDVTTSAEGLTYSAGQAAKTAPGAPNATDNAVIFYVRVLNEPLAIDSSYADMLLRDNWLPPQTQASQGPQDKGGRMVRPRMMFRGRVLRSNNGLQPHIFLPDPCKIASAGTETIDYINLVTLQHTLFISKDSAEGVMPKMNDVVIVTLGVSDFATPELQVSGFDSIASVSDAAAYGYQAENNCDSLVDRVAAAGFGTGAGEYVDALPPPRPTYPAVKLTWEQCKALQKTVVFEPILKLIRDREGGPAGYNAFNMGTTDYLGIEFKDMLRFRSMKYHSFLKQGWTSSNGTWTPRKNMHTIIANEDIDYNLTNYWLPTIFWLQGQPDAINLYIDNADKDVKDFFKATAKPTAKARGWKSFFALGGYQIIPKTMLSLINSLPTLKKSIGAPHNEKIKAGTYPADTPKFDQPTQDALAIMLLLCKAGNEYASGAPFTRPSLLGGFLMGLASESENPAPRPELYGGDTWSSALWAGQALSYEWAFAPLQFNGTDHINPTLKRRQSAYSGTAGNAASVNPEQVMAAIRDSALSLAPGQSSTPAQEDAAKILKKALGSSVPTGSFLANTAYYP